MVYLGQLLRTTVPGVRVFCWDLGNLTAAEASHPCIGGADLGHCATVCAAGKYLKRGAWGVPYRG